MFRSRLERASRGRVRVQPEWGLGMRTPRLPSAFLLLHPVHSAGGPVPTPLPGAHVGLVRPPRAWGLRGCLSA